MWITYKEVFGVNARDHITFVRGRVIDFNPYAIREVLQIPRTMHSFGSYIERVHRGQQLERVLADICIPGSQWILGAEGKAGHLRVTT
ncbi:hypothetical protein AHAS_Ahas10G0025300 [Arachis hypogaea]